jgi:DNA-cytosine methyltransferase
MQAGYSLLWGVELDPTIAAVAQQNLGHPVYQSSVVDMDWATLERPDHLHMSPPCQDFSVAKKTGTVRNDNDALAEACISAIRTLEPATVTLENVEGYRKAPGFQAIVDTLYSLGYWVDWQVLNSADMGVPQTRRRLFLRAARGMFLPPLPAPVPWVGWYQAIEDLIPTLPETQFAAWQLKRLPEEFKETCFIEDQNSSRDATIRGVDDPVPTVISGALRRPSSSPKAYLLGNGTYSATIDHKLPAQTITSSDNQTGVRALLVESKNANQQYGDGLREPHEPCTTVITDHKPSHQPKALLIPGGNASSFSTRSGNEPSLTVESTERVGNIPRAFIWSTAEEREEFEYQERLRWAEEDRAKHSTVQGRVVRMTPRALARFQTVPDWYALPEKNALACRIIGNGVPCLMMQRIMEAF